MIQDKESEMEVTISSCCLRGVTLSNFNSMVPLFLDLEIEGGCPRLFHEWFAFRQFSTFSGFA